MRKLILLAGILVLASGCTTIEQAKVLPNDPDFAPILPEME